MSTSRPVKYHSAAVTHSSTPYLHLVQPQPSQGTGAEAVQVAALMETLADRLAATETLARTVLSIMDGEMAEVSYDHVAAKHVATVRVRYRDAGRLLPREVVVDDE